MPRDVPTFRAALLRAAVADLEAGRFDAAERSAEHAADGDAADLDATLLRGLAKAARGEALLAAPLLQLVAIGRPDFAHPCRDLARLRPDAPRLAAAQFRACRALAPNDAGIAYAYADFLLDGGNPAAAAAVLRQLLSRQPEFGPAHNLYGMALVDLGDLPSAIAAFERATMLDPDEGATWTNLGMALKIEGRFDEALSAYERAVARAPADPRIRLNRAIALLRAGRMAEAWPDYEQRLRVSPSARLSAALPADRLLPALDGIDLAGRTVLVWHEEGFGDTLQFCRYIPLLAARGARVLAWMPPELTRLIGTLDGVSTVFDGGALPAFDWHCPCLSLPRAFATTLGSIPATLPYLRAEPALAQSWAARLPPEGFRVGVVWAGQARPWLPGFAGLDVRRSTSLATLAPLAQVPGVRLISLQKGPPAVEAVAPPRGTRLHDPMDAVRDFADTAGIVANLDAVVAVDTSVVHLAGAMAKPVLLLDRYDSCWRWLAERRDSPWYPSMHILRQTAPGDWAPVVAEAARLLARMAGQPRGGAGPVRLARAAAAL
jgi:tetratricopeptide (TPR) repeat protein